MTTKNLTILVGVAAVLGVAAYLAGNDGKASAPKLNGRQILPALDVSGIARIEIGDKLTLTAGEKGWTIDSLYGYPADRAKIAEHLLGLQELRVGQVARGRKLGAVTPVRLKDAAGKTVAELKLGDKHTKMGGRYLDFGGETVLVRDSLEAFDGEVKKWCNPRIASISSGDVTAIEIANGAEKLEMAKGTNGVWTVKGLGDKEEFDTSKSYSIESALAYLDFTSVVDPKLTEAELGFKTGFVYTVTAKEGTNTVKHVAHIGNEAKGGTDRYFKLDDGKWVYTISSYAAGNMSKRRADVVKAKKVEEAKPAAKTEAKPKK